MGEWGDVYCSPHFLGCSKGSPDHRNLEFSACLKMCPNSFYPRSSNHPCPNLFYIELLWVIPSRAAASLSLGSGMSQKPTDREMTERRRQRRINRAGEMPHSPHYWCWPSPWVPVMCSSLLQETSLGYTLSQVEVFCLSSVAYLRGVFVLFLWVAAQEWSVGGNRVAPAPSKRALGCFPGHLFLLPGEI